MRVSVICTVLNEGEAIRRLMDSLCAQTRPPDEVVIVDGGSADDTVPVLRSYAGRLPLRIIALPGANISAGRNAAIAAATGEAIASTDAGVWLEPGWLEALMVPLEAGAGVQAAAGFFVADPATLFEIAMGATVLPSIEDVDPATFLPSSRSVAFLKDTWARSGGYPEWLDYCEDLIFDFRLRDAAGPLAWAPGAVAHFRPRRSLAAFARQYYRYARGDGKADLWRKRHAVRYATYLAGLAAVLALTRQGNGTQSGVSRIHDNGFRGSGAENVRGVPVQVFGRCAAASNAAAALALVAGALVYCAKPYRRLWPQLGKIGLAGRAYTLALVPLIRAVGDVAKMAGYPAGWAWRIRNWGRAEIHRR